MKNYSLSKHIDKKDVRQAEWKKQRKERGFDNTELWNLDATIANFIIPRLKAFKETKGCHPGNFKNEKAWDKCIDEMIFAFEFASNEGFGVDYASNKKRADKGLKLFAKYYFHLWD
jgi:hypothetical protein